MSITLSKKSGETLRKLQRAMRLPERPPLLRLALAKGLVYCGGNVPGQDDSQGPEIPLRVITRGEDLLMDALVTEALGKPIPPGQRKRFYKCLVDFGLVIMSKEHDAVDTNSDYLVELVRSTINSVGRPQAAVK